MAKFSQLRKQGVDTKKPSEESVPDPNDLSTFGSVYGGRHKPTDPKRRFRRMSGANAVGGTSTNRSASSKGKGKAA